MANEKVPTLTVNGKEYEIAALSQEAREELNSLRFAQSDVNRLNAQLAIAKTALNAYRSSLITKLPQ